MGYNLSPLKIKVVGSHGVHFSSIYHGRSEMLMFKTSSPGALLKHAAFQVRICWWLVLQDQRLESQKRNGIERGGVDYVYIYTIHVC